LLDLHDRLGATAQLRDTVTIVVAAAAVATANTGA
jgi:hypothetical protein